MKRVKGTRKVLALAVLALIGLGATARQSSEIPDPPTDTMEPQVRAKISRLRRAVAASSRSSSAWGTLGKTFHAHGLEEEAELSYRRAAEIDPKEFRWPYLRAVVLKNTRTEEALAQAVRAAVLNPSYVPAHLLAAELLERANEPEEAMARYEKVASETRSAQAELGLGRLLMLRGELDAAFEHLQLAAEYQPRVGSVHAALARLHARRGERAMAEQASKKARTLPARIGVDDPVMTEVSDEAVSSRGYEQRALRAEASGEPGEAERLYERLLELRPDEADILYNFGNLYVRQRRFQEAIARYVEALDARPDHVPARVNLGNALAMLGKLGEATAHLQMALDDAPADSDAHRTLGRIFAYRGDYASAIGHYRAVLEIAPTDGEVHRDLAIALAREGEFAAAWTHVEAAHTLGVQLPEEFLAKLRAVHPPQ